MSPAPMSQLFSHVPELLEEIMSYLDKPGLLRARAVCKATLHAIEDSPRLAVRLFHANQSLSTPTPSPCLQQLCKLAGVTRQTPRPGITCLVDWSSRSSCRFRFVQSSIFLAKMLPCHPAPRHVRIRRLCSCDPWRRLIRSVSARAGAFFDGRCMRAHA